MHRKKHTAVLLQKKRPPTELMSMRGGCRVLGVFKSLLKHLCQPQVEALNDAVLLCYK